MAIFSKKRSIFFKIYSGLLIVCAFVIFFSYVFVSTINQVRLQSYRENIAVGIFEVVGSGLQRQPANNRKAWLQRISELFGDNFLLVSADSVRLSVKDLRELTEGGVVVKDSGFVNQFRIFHQVDGFDDLLMLEITQVGDRQARAMATLLLEELQNYDTRVAKSSRLDELNKQTGYQWGFKSMDSLNLGENQLSRLLAGDTVIAFVDGNAYQQPTVLMIAPSDLSDTVLVVGPIPLFQWFPANLLLSTALIAMMLISLGVYAIIYPLERRLGLLQIGVNEVSKGKLDTKVQVVGYDDIARLSATFNTMTAHIKRLIESQRELTRAVSHELRTPVARIRFAVDMLADTDEIDERELQRQQIDQDIESLNELIDEILTYAKLEQGSPKLNWESVDLHTIIHQVVQETNALGKPIAVQYSLPSGKSLVTADKKYLHRVIQNFAGNALRYAKSTIIISAWVDKGMAFVSVEDDGEGISEADRQKVFIPFARLDDSRTRASGGYGLGLSIVSRIAFWFGGQAMADKSLMLGGAKFTMSWPVKQVGVNILADDAAQDAYQISYY